MPKSFCNIKNKGKKLQEILQNSWQTKPEKLIFKDFRNISYNLGQSEWMIQYNCPPFWNRWTLSEKEFYSSSWDLTDLTIGRAKGVLYKILEPVIGFVGKAEYSWEKDTAQTMLDRYIDKVAGPEDIKDEIFGDGIVNLYEERGKFIELQTFESLDLGTIDVDFSTITEEVIFSEDALSRLEKSTAHLSRFYKK